MTGDRLPDLEPAQRETFDDWEDAAGPAWAPGDGWDDAERNGVWPAADAAWAEPGDWTEPARATGGAWQAPSDGRAREARPPGTAGALVAVCGLCGGAGASTVAYLTARAAARATDEPVLVCDTGGPTGGLAAYAGVETPRSLPKVAAAVTAHEPLAGALFADAADGLRVMASRPELGVLPDVGGLARVLTDARAAHALTLVDCGLPAGAGERRVLEASTHVVWVLPATRSGVHRAGAALALFGLDASRREIVVARGDPGASRAPTDELTRLAGTRCAPLVLMPHVPDLHEHDAERALDQAALSLDAIRMAIRT